MAIEAVVDTLGVRGDGIARSPEGKVVYVSGALPGERVTIVPSGQDRFNVTEVLVPSPHRQAAPCPYFGTCGGCALQHMNADFYVRFKRFIVLDALKKAGVEAPEPDGPYVSAPGSRRRATFAAQMQGKKLVFGFNERRSLNLVSIESCTVLQDSIVAPLTPLREVLAAIMKNRQKADITVTVSGKALDVLITSSLAEDGKMPFATLEALTAFAQKNGVARLSWRPDIKTEPELVLQNADFSVTFGGIKVVPPGGGFLQATEEGERILTDCVLSAFENAKAKKVADLYAGCGTFSLPLLVRGLKVDAYEGFAPAVESLRAAVKGRTGLEAICRDLVKDPLNIKELDAYDAIVLDPPRDGASPQAKQIAKSKVMLAVYVSCNAESFARDARYLIDSGFRIEKITLIDQFLWSHHIELVGIFRR